MRLKMTERGFKRGEFTDLYGEACSIQESSSVKPSLWLGCEHESVHGVTGEKIGARMHLDQRLAKQLLRHLQQFVKTGRL